MGPLRRRSHPAGSEPAFRSRRGRRNRRWCVARGDRRGAEERQRHRDDVAQLRDDLEQRIAMLEKALASKLPIAKEFVAGVVHYAGDVVTFKGSTYQAIKDSA